jgi:hypothetical protein
MKIERKTSRGNVWGSIIIFLAMLWLICLFASRPSESVTVAAKSPIAESSSAPLLSTGTVPASFADNKVKSVFVFNFQHRGDDLDQQTAFDDVMLSSSFQQTDPINPQTGQPQHGYYARSIYDAFDFIDRPMADPNDIWQHATELHLYWQDGSLHGNFGGKFHTFRFDPYVEGQIAPTLVMNIVFDLPSGGHKYMKAIGYQSTDDGVVIDDSQMPEMLAGIMTSQYMHIFVPSDDDASGTTELVFWTDSFKDLLSPDDHKQAQASMLKLDHDTPVTYDSKEKNHASPQASGYRPGRVGAVVD